jgi:putative membrane protein
MIEIVVSILIGLGLGIVAGLVPGLHPNFIAVLLFTSFLNPNLIFVLVAMLISSQFFEFIRSVFLFVPNDDNVLAMHPIFKMVKEGKALFALKLCLNGLIIAILFSILASPLLILFVPPVFTAIHDFVPFMLLGIAIFLIFSDEKPFAAVLVFLSAGAVGYFGLNILHQPLLILLTGFFGLPILLSIQNKIPKQIVSYKFETPKGSIKRGLLSGFVSSFLLTFIPSVGPAQASVFSRGLLKKSEDFLVAIGVISGLDSVFSLLMLYSIGRSRVGVIEILGKGFTVDLTMLVLLLLTMLTVAIISYLLALQLGKFFSKRMATINYRLLSVIVVLAIASAAFYFDGLFGLFFLGLAAGVGILASRLKTKMTHCMGSLMIPTLIYYFV